MYMMLTMNDTKSEFIGVRIDMQMRKRIGVVSKQLGLSESETIRTILDSSLGFSSEELTNVSQAIQRQLKQLAFDREQLHALRDLDKDVTRKYGALSALRATKAGLKKTPAPGFE